MNEQRKSWKKGLPLAIFLIFLIGCGKNFDRFSAYPAAGDVNQFFETVQTLNINFSINAENGAYYITQQRTILNIPPNTFVYADGTPVTGAVDIEFLELYDKGLFVMYDVPTVSNGQLLESDGVFNISAQKNNTDVFIAPGKEITIQVSNDNPNPEMILFYGDNDGLEDTFNWSPVFTAGSTTWANVSLAEWAVQDSMNQLYDFGYEFTIDQLTWINVDIFKDIPEELRTDACVELPDIYTNINTKVFMIFKDINGVLSMLGDSEKMLFCEPYGLTPVGYEVTFVVISHQGDDVYHFGLADAIIERNHREFIVPEEKSIQEILDILGMF